MHRALQIWSGGQTGVDRAALDVACELGLSIHGWVPRGRLAENGVIPPRYEGLRETDSADYGDRTRRNVHDTDATLVFRVHAASGGTRTTLELAQQLRRPCLDVDLGSQTPQEAAGEVTRWLNGLMADRTSLRLNVAGPRASEAPGVHALARETLRLVLAPYSWGPSDQR